MDITFIKNNLEKLKKDSLNTALKTACEMNDFDMVEYLLTSDDLKIKPDIEVGSILNHSNQPLISAAKNGNLKIVRFLLESEKLKKKAYIHACNDEVLLSAMKNNHVDIVDYLLNKKYLKSTIFHVAYTNLYQCAKTSANDVIFYLLKNKNKFLPKSNIKDFKDCEYNLLFNIKKEDNELLMYIILKYDMDITNKIKEKLNNDDYLYIRKLIEKKDLINKLEKNLEIKNNTKRKPKI